LKNTNNLNAKRLAVLISALLGGVAYGQETTLSTIEVSSNVLKVAKQGSVEDAYRVESLYSLGPLGTAKLLDTPNSIAILPSALIENVQATSVKEALKYVPLAQFQEQQGSEVLRPATRGMQGSNYQNTRLDGMTVFATGANAIEQLQQIEVFSGSPAAAYGPANPAGMFNFVSKRPTSEPLRRLTVGYTTSNIFTEHADLGGPIDDNGVVSYRLNLLNSHGTGFVANSELDRKLFSLGVDVRPSRDTTVELNYSVYELQQKGYPGWFTYGQKIALPSAPDATKVGYGQAYAGVDLKNTTANARLKQDLGSGWNLVVGGLTQKVERIINTPVNNLTNNTGSYTTSLGSGFAPTFAITSDIAYLNGAFKTGEIGHDLTLGTTGFRSVSNGSSNTPLPASILLGSATIANPRIFAEPATGLPNVDPQYQSSVATQQGINISDTITFSKAWSARLALSQDWMDTKNYSKTGAQTSAYSAGGLSPMPSLMYKFQENVTSYVTYASSLQQGDIAPANAANANTSLAPYRSKQWETGLKIALSKMDLAFALFQLERPFARLDSADNTYKIAGQQLNNGLEATAVGEITDHLVVYSGITLLDPKLKGTGVQLTENKQYVGMPKVRSNILLEYQVPALAGVVLSADWQYVGRRAANDANTTWADSYNVFDLGARYTTRLMGKATTWRLALNNVTDEHYWSTVGPSNITGANTSNMTAHLGAPRTIAASMTVDF
jgi:iron complex outermembrane recepter protein